MARSAPLCTNCVSLTIGVSLTIAEHWSCIDCMSLAISYRTETVPFFILGRCPRRYLYCPFGTEVRPPSNTPTLPSARISRPSFGTSLLRFSGGGHEALRLPAAR